MDLTTLSDEDLNNLKRQIKLIQNERRHIYLKDKVHKSIEETGFFLDVDDELGSDTLGYENSIVDFRYHASSYNSDDYHREDKDVYIETPTEDEIEELEELEDLMCKWFYQNSGKYPQINGPLCDAKFEVQEYELDSPDHFGASCQGHAWFGIPISIFLVF